MVAYPGKPSDPRAARRLNAPRPAAVEADNGVPLAVGRTAVAAVREEWRVVDRWWTGEPVRRRYFDLLLASGEQVVVYHDEEADRWFRQRA